MGTATLATLFHQRVEKSPFTLAFEEPVRGVWTGVCWREVAVRVRNIALGLHKMGLAAGDRCAILSETSLAWILVDLGALCGGYATTTIYPSNTADDCEYILRNSGSRVLFVEDRAQAERIAPLRKRLPDLIRVVVLNESGPDGLSAFEAEGEAFGRSQPGEYERRAQAIGPDDTATLIYTSGTTGRPKGVLLTHDNWVFEAETLAKTLGHHVRPDDKQYLFLPMAHCYGKVLQLCALELGVPTAINADIPGILKGLSEVRPTFMGAVPRVFEKVHATAGAKARARGPRAYGVFEWAEGVAKRWAKATVAGRPVGPRLAVEHAVADRLVYRQIRKALGGRVRAFLSGGAPLAEELSWFFYGAGVLVLEGYGLTETSAGAVANTLDDFRFGTVGRPAPGVRVKIAPDGEVLLAGRGIMRGYHADPEATAAVLQGGWFHSGDLGEIDKDGFLKITGRKKDILVTAGGKNISPQNLENRVKTQVPWVQELVVLGDRRPFCVALVCIDEAAVQSWADDQGLGVTGYAALSAHPRVQALVWEGISAVNQGLASYETIKAIALLDHLVSVESGELTPSQKVKRKVVESRHLKLLDRLYGVA